MTTFTTRKSTLPPPLQYLCQESSCFLLMQISCQLMFILILKQNVSTGIIRYTYSHTSHVASGTSLAFAQCKLCANCQRFIHVSLAWVLQICIPNKLLINYNTFSGYQYIAFETSHVPAARLTCCQAL